MTQIVLNVEDASLLPSLKQILGAIKGVTIKGLNTSSTEVEAEKAFINETINKGYREAQEGRFAGKDRTALDALVEELRAEAGELMVTFNFTEEFLRQAKRLAKRYHSLADDIDALQHELMENPNIGISLGGGKRKIRLGVQSKGGGKRGGLRVITLNIVIETSDTCVNLLTIYDKKEIPNVSDKYIDQIIKNL